MLLYIPYIVAMLTAMQAPPVQQVNDGNYQRYVTQDSCVIEVLDYGKKALVVQTVCAPICSSSARMYNTKSNKLIREIKPPFEGVFPYAWIENGTLHWQDNTTEMLDEQEKNNKH
ncbi:MAG: hypothetical protein IKT19_01850 [Paludibacteraceae bacterium]|nr:hypothetical protein [Paludibacteraceae bacterium]